MSDARLRAVDLDPLSECMLVMDNERFPRCGYIFLVLQGAVNVESMARAVSVVTDVVPFNSLLREQRRDGRHLMVWVPRDGPPPDLRVEDLRQAAKGRTTREALARRFGEEVNRMMRLDAEPPLRTYLLRLDEQLWALVFFTHHVAMDGGQLVDSFAGVMSEYNREVRGDAPSWASDHNMLSMLAGRKEAPRISRGSYMKAVAGEALRNALRPPARLAPDRSPDQGSRRTNLRAVIEEADVRALSSAARSIGATMNDLLVANSVLTIAAWNRKFGRHSRRITIGVPVNLRPFISTEEAGNHSSLITIETAPQDRAAEPTRLLALVKAKRETELDRMIFVKHLSAVSRIVGTFRRLRFESRSKVLARLMAQPWSLVLSNLGIIFPEVAEGRATGDSFLREAGGLEITDFDMNFSVLAHAGYGMLAYTFRRRLHLVLSTLLGQFTPQESGSFLGLFVETLDRFKTG